MAFQRLRQLLMVGACAMLLAACGGSSVVSKFTPTRLVAFGDAFADLGQAGTSRYTINNPSPSGSTVNNWLLQVAYRYSLALSARADVTGAIDAATSVAYGAGNARAVATTDAAGGAAPSVKDQIDRFLLTDGASFLEGDLVLVSAGTADIVAEAMNSSQSSTDMLANVKAAARALGGQVRRLVDAGARHVALVGPYNLDRSPWALGTSPSRAAELRSYSNAFNEELKVSIVDLGNQVLYVDAALFFDLMTNVPAAYGLGDATTLACTSTGGAGIGLGSSEVNSALCDGTTLATSTPDTFLFADKLYPTAVGHRLLGDFAYGKVSGRW